MTSAQVVETSVNVNNNSFFQNYTNPDDHTQQTTDTPGFKFITIYGVKLKRKKKKKKKLEELEEAKAFTSRNVYAKFMLSCLKTYWNMKAWT